MIHILGGGILVGYLLASVLLLVGLYRPMERACDLGRRFHKGSLLGLVILCVVRVVAQIPDALWLSGDYYLVIVLFCNVLALWLGFTAPVFELLLACTTLLLFTGSSLLLHESTPQPDPKFSHVLVATHVLPALFAQAALVLAAVVACGYLLIRKKLKRREIDAVTLAGPGLVYVERSHQLLCFTGLTAMTIAVLTGAVRGVHDGVAIDLSDGTQLLALFSWILLAFVVHVRRTERLSMAKTAMITLVGAVVVVLGSFGMVLFHDSEMHPNSVQYERNHS
jgi:ABC-type uncharacterized transport system permease subunit